MTPPEMRKAAHLVQRAVNLFLINSAVRPDLRAAVRFHLMFVVFGVRQPLLAAINHCTKQNVSKHVAKVERLRDDDPDFDRILTDLEQQLTGGADL